ncbi:MAG: hypothetical protein JWO31_3285, partial [Phycisphaerales bacterium]|nr:hypothetical protein [Phycisphaerales bacterium]
MGRPDRRLAFHLCRELGAIHPDHLLASLTARQWDEWVAYFSIYPTAEDRADARAAMLSTVTARSAGQKRAKFKDFMPDYVGRHRARRDQTPEE